MRTNEQGHRGGPTIPVDVRPKWLAARAVSLWRIEGGEPIPLKDDRDDGLYRHLGFTRITT